ncbi:MAG: hypothetical protein ABIR03_07920 [Ginsengibacter sp.]
MAQAPAKVGEVSQLIFFMKNCSSGKRISANILLSFTLNKKSTPAHIKVLESACKPCETEAIRLLKEGPHWVGKPGAKGKVRIEF